MHSTIEQEVLGESLKRGNKSESTNAAISLITFLEYTKYKFPEYPHTLGYYTCAHTHTVHTRTQFSIYSTYKDTVQYIQGYSSVHTRIQFSTYTGLHTGFGARGGKLSFLKS